MALRCDALDGVGVEMAAAVQLLWQCFRMRPSTRVVSTVDGPPIVFFIMEGCPLEDGPPTDFCGVGPFKTDVEVNNGHSSPRLMQRAQVIRLSNIILSHRFFEKRQEAHAL